MDLEASKVIRRIRGDLPFIVFMGPQPTYEPDAFINHSNDIVIRGEIELTMEEFTTNGRVENIQGISYQKNGKINHNPARPFIDNLNELPFPARHLIKKDKYFNPKLRSRPSAVVLASMGLCEPLLLLCSVCT